ncbi:proliferating cell nuclear antigen (pcna) [Candidatus Woesearchaeota archaeon]|nr:proliferating cell nuclear antigen (pcna) [Candidatus Woesearchaeota archaeon]
MRLVLAEPKFLKDSINIISELVNEVTLKIDKNKIELIALDPANVAMVVFRLLSSAFVEYEVDKPQEISINLDSFKQVLRRAKSRDVIILELIKKNQLTIKFKGESAKTFNLALIDIEEKEQKIPDLKFPLRVEIPSTIFDECVEDMSIISESVALIAEKDKFTIQAESKLNTAKVEITPDEETKIIVSNNDPVLARYSIEYLKKIAKASKLSDTVMLEFNKEYPLRAVFRVMDKLDLQFILAPRVSND